MIVMICSDIHGSREAVKTLLEEKNKLSAEIILSAGDQCPDEENSFFYSSLISVVGNCDRFYHYSKNNLPPEVWTGNLNGRNIIMTHGDRKSVNDFSLKEGDIFISGHTHIPLLYISKKGFIVLNPGSPSRPRSNHGPTYAFMDEREISLVSLSTGKRIITLKF